MKIEEWKGNREKKCEKRYWERIKGRWKGGN